MVKVTKRLMRLATDAIVADPDLSVIFAVNDPSAKGCKMQFNKLV